MDGQGCPSSWCASMKDAALERGDEKAAMAYFDLETMWRKREDEKMATFSTGKCICGKSSSGECEGRCATG